MREIPEFAVIGRVNKGKSSIVSTLAEDDTVQIESAAGTTKSCRRYPVRLDGEKTLLVLIDTPGFQQAPRALAWLREHEVSAADRQEVVAAFLETFRNSGEFIDECRLLEPIMQGAGILYVVDGARPFRRSYEAEMEILRWTGRPRMALINKIGEGDHSDDWRPALDQYFSMVRSFDAQNVRFEDRIGLLQAFRELHEPWRAALDETIRLLQQDWQRREREAAHIIARLLVDELTCSLEISLQRHERIEDRQQKIVDEFHQTLRRYEARARRHIEGLYQHSRIAVEESELERPLFEQDLFAEQTWAMLGLSGKQLVALGAVTGAAVGGVLDTAVGGASFMAGSLLGGLVGAGTALYYSGHRLATIQDLGTYFRGGRVVRIGPHKNKNFPWIVLDRALLHYRSIRDRAHSVQEPVKIDANQKAGVVSRLAPSQRKKLAKIFTDLQKKRFTDTARLERRLEDQILKIIQDDG